MKNEITIHGYLGRDPELKTYTGKDGKTGYLVNLSVGVGRDQGDVTDWFRCTAFGKRAEVIDKFFRKGSEILLTGRMQNETYEKDGQKRDSWRLIVSGFDFCGKRDDAGSRGSGTEWATGAGNKQPADSFEQVEDDVPW